MGIGGVWTKPCRDALSNADCRTYSPGATGKGLRSTLCVVAFVVGNRLSYSGVFRQPIQRAKLFDFRSSRVLCSGIDINYIFHFKKIKMKRRFIIFLLSIITVSETHAQTVDAVLSTVERNNKGIQSNKKY